MWVSGDFKLGHQINVDSNYYYFIFSEILWHYFGIYRYSFLTVLLHAAERPQFLPRGLSKVLSYLILFGLQID